MGLVARKESKRKKIELSSSGYWKLNASIRWQMIDPVILTT
jgi:hypothetical protein